MAKTKKDALAEPTAQSIGKRIKKARDAKGESQFGLALETGMTVDSLELAESGRYSLSGVVLWKVARALGVTVDELLKP